MSPAGPGSLLRLDGVTQRFSLMTHRRSPSTTIYPVGTRVRIVATVIHVVAFPLTDAD
jgi:hypothetical protein